MFPVLGVQGWTRTFSAIWSISDLISWGNVVLSYPKASESLWIHMKGSFWDKTALSPWEQRISLVSIMEPDCFTYIILFNFSELLRVGLIILEMRNLRLRKFYCLGANLHRKWSNKNLNACCLQCRRPWLDSWVGKILGLPLWLSW